MRGLPTRATLYARKLIYSDSQLSLQKGIDLECGDKSLRMVLVLTT